MCLGNREHKFFFRLEKKSYMSGNDLLRQDLRKKSAGIKSIQQNECNLKIQFGSLSEFR